MLAYSEAIVAFDATTESLASTATECKTCSDPKRSVLRFQTPPFNMVDHGMER
jgi:hypothetical protein